MNTTALQLASVAGGGALGALARYGMSVWFVATFPGRFNLATLLVNVIGSLLMGLAYVVIVEKMLLPPVLRQLLMVGFLGAFTTFSTFSLEALALMHSGQFAGALAYVATSVVLSLTAVGLGVFIAQQLLNQV